MINQKCLEIHSCVGVRYCKENYWNRVENRNRNGVTRNKPDDRLNPPITVSPLKQAAL